jgi:formylglycine-generating enzyme required for sulfatase activity
MAGNVWEWCSSLYTPYPYQARDGREDLAAEGRRAMRGGTFGLDRRKLRCAYRNRNRPDDYGFTIGFRVVFDTPPPGSMRSDT